LLKLLRAVPPALCSLLAALTPCMGEAPAAGTWDSPRPIPAQEPPAPPQMASTAVSLARVVMIAREKAPAIAAARARVARAEGLKRSAVLFPDPDLTAGFGHGESRDGTASSAEWRLEVGQFLPAPWGLRARGRSATASIDAAQREVEAVTADVVFEARLLYYEAAVGKLQATALAQAAADASAVRELMSRRVQVGEAPESDALRTRVEALRADLQARESAAGASGARAALNRFLLGALGPDYSTSLDPDPGSVPIGPEGLLASMISGNPDYRAAQSRVEEARSALSAERASRLPGLGLSVYSERELDRMGTGATVGLSVPLWNRNQASVASSSAALSEAEAEALEIRTRLEMQSERLALRARTAREIAIEYHEEVLPVAIESLSISRFSVEQGEASLLSWLDARRIYLEVLRASNQAYLDALQSWAELERLKGDSDAPDQQ